MSREEIAASYGITLTWDPEEQNDDYETYAQCKKRMRRYLKSYPNLRQTIEDLWRPSQIGAIKNLLNTIDTLGEFGRPNKRERSIVNHQLALLLQNAPIEELPESSGELSVLITLVNSERSSRSKRRILGEIHTEWLRNPQSILTQEVRDDMRLLGWTRGFEQDSSQMKQMSLEQPV